MSDDEHRRLSSPSSQSLAPRDEGHLAVGGAAGPDRYEQKYMAGATGIIARAKMRAGWKYHAVWATVLAILLLESSAAVHAAAAVVITGALWLLFSVLRVTVTEREVAVQYGLFGPRIPISRISSAEAVEYDWTRYGGWGIRRKWFGGETVYNMPGDGGKAVRIRWRDRANRERSTVVGTLDSKALAQAIERQRRANASEDPTMPRLSAAESSLALEDGEPSESE